MEFIQELLQETELRQLCVAALLEEGKLPDALEAILRMGFGDQPYVEGAAAEFAQRLLAVQQEYTAQRELFQRDPDAWAADQLEIAENPTLMTCALAALTEDLHGKAGQQAEFRKLLERRARQGASKKENRALLVIFAQTSLTGLFPGGLEPELPREMLLRAAALGAMCGYVALKREPPERVSPEISFDAASVWGLAAVEVLCGEQGDASLPQAAAVVAGTMSAQYMYARDWQVLLGCMVSLGAYVRLVADRVLMPVGKLAGEARKEPVPEHWVRREEEEVSFTPWLRLLKQWGGEQTKAEKRDHAKEEIIKQMKALCQGTAEKMAVPLVGAVLVSQRSMAPDRPRLERQHPEIRYLVAYFQRHPELPELEQIGDVAEADPRVLRKIARDLFCRNSELLMQREAWDKWVKALQDNMGELLRLLNDMMRAARQENPELWEDCRGQLLQQLRRLETLEARTRRTYPWPEDEIPDSLRGLASILEEQQERLARKPETTGYMPLFERIRRVRITGALEEDEWYRITGGLLTEGMEKLSPTLRAQLLATYPYLTGPIQAA